MALKHTQKRYKWINDISLSILFFALLFLIIKVHHDSKLLINPLLPKHLAIYTNGKLINLLSFTLGGSIAAIFLRIRKKYIISTISIFTFFIIGYILKDSIYIYEHFYE